MIITKINMFELEDASEESIQENVRQESPQRKLIIKSKLLNWIDQEPKQPLRKKPPAKISAEQFAKHYDDVFEDVFGDKVFQLPEEPQKKPRRKPQIDSDEDKPRPPPRKRNPPKPKVNDNGEEATPEPRPKRIRKKPEPIHDGVIRKAPSRSRAKPQNQDVNKDKDKTPMEKKPAVRRKPQKKQDKLDKLNEMDDFFDPDQKGIDEIITSKTGPIKIMKFDMDMGDEQDKQSKMPDGAKKNASRKSRQDENSQKPRDRKKVKKDSEDEIINRKTKKVRQVQRRDISPTHSEQLSPKPYIQQISRRKRNPPELTAEEKASIESKRLASPDKDEILDCDANTEKINPHLKKCVPNLYLDYEKDFQITQHDGGDKKSAIYTGRIGDKFKEYTYLQLSRKCPNKLNEYISQNY